MFFNSWYALARVLVVGILAYAGLVFLLRVSGKRTLSKPNPFDLVVTVALGSMLTTVTLSKDVNTFTPHRLMQELPLKAKEHGFGT